MSNLTTVGRFSMPIDAATVRADWAERGYSCHDFLDPPGQAWMNFVHETNEVVTVVSGRLQLTVGNEEVVAMPGDEVLIPRRAIHSVVNISGGKTHWLFGYDET